MPRISLASRLPVGNLGLGTASLLGLVASHRSGVRFSTHSAQALCCTLTPFRDAENRTRANNSSGAADATHPMKYPVGLPGIEPGLQAPHACVLPVYYSPTGNFIPMLATLTLYDIPLW